MKKIKTLLFCFVPLLLAMSFQYATVIFSSGMAVLLRLPKEGPAFFKRFYSLLLDSDFNACVMLIYCLLIISLFGMWYYSRMGGDFLPNPHTTFQPLIFLGLVILVPGAQYVCGFVVSIISALVPGILEQYEKILEVAGFSAPTPLLVAYAVILGPIAEELIFRGIIMRQARKTFPFYLANIIQAVLFGIYHMNFIQGCYAALLGLVLGYICERGGSIYYSIFFHMLFNLWGTLGGKLMVFDNDYITAAVMLLTLMISLPLGILLFQRGLKRKAL